MLFFLFWSIYIFWSIFSLFIFSSFFFQVYYQRWASVEQKRRWVPGAATAVARVKDGEEEKEEELKEEDYEKSRMNRKRKERDEKEEDVNVKEEEKVTYISWGCVREDGGVLGLKKKLMKWEKKRMTMRKEEEEDE